MWPINASHCSMLGLTRNGCDSKQTLFPKSRRDCRRRQSERDSSETTRAFPAVTGRPASSPPVFKRASNTDSNVVFPSFHWLVSNVTLPDARYPSHTQLVGGSGASSGSPGHVSGGKGQISGRVGSASGYGSGASTGNMAAILSFTGTGERNTSFNMKSWSDMELGSGFSVW